jgi:hypothetical protein
MHAFHLSSPLGEGLRLPNPVEPAIWHQEGSSRAYSSCCRAIDPHFKPACMMDSYEALLVTVSPSEGAEADTLPGCGVVPD